LTWLGAGVIVPPVGVVKHYPILVAAATTFFIFACRPAWDTYRGAAGRTASLRPDFVGPPHAATWTLPLKASSFSSPVLAGPYLLVGSNDDNLNVIDAARGEVLYRFRTGGDVAAGAALAGNTAFFGSADGHLYALDLPGGRLKWKFRAGSKIAADPVVAAGKVFFGTLEGDVFAVGARNAKLKWTARDAGPIWTTPCFADKSVYVASHRGRVLCLDAANGRQRWSYDAGAPLSAPPLVEKGALVVASESGEVAALDPANARPLWRYPAGEGISGLAAAEGAVFTGTWEGTLVALRLADGARLWQAEVEGAVEGSPAVAQGLVYVGTAAGKIYALRAHDGGIAWEADAPAGVSSSLAVGPDAVYAVADDVGQGRGAQDLPRPRDLFRGDGAGPAQHRERAPRGVELDGQRYELEHHRERVKDYPDVNQKSPPENKTADKQGDEQLRAEVGDGQYRVPYRQGGVPVAVLHRVAHFVRGHAVRGDARAARDAGRKAKRPRTRVVVVRQRSANLLEGDAAQLFLLQQTRGHLGPGQPGRRPHLGVFPIGRPDLPLGIKTQQYYRY
jgi:outer membrane protein assembly factor BamB